MSERTQALQLVSPEYLSIKCIAEVSFAWFLLQANKPGKARQLLTTSHMSSSSKVGGTPCIPSSALLFPWTLPLQAISHQDAFSPAAAGTPSSQPDLKTMHPLPGCLPPVGWVQMAF